jgi:hypothetical protein
VATACTDDDARAFEDIRQRVADIRGNMRALVDTLDRPADLGADSRVLVDTPWSDRSSGDTRALVDTPQCADDIDGDARALVETPWSDCSSSTSTHGPFARFSPPREGPVPPPPRLVRASAPELIREMWDFWISAGLEDAPENPTSERVLIVTAKGTACFGSELADTELAMQVCTYDSKKCTWAFPTLL